MPDIVSPEYVPTLVSLCREQYVNAILSFYDPDINTLSQHLDEFRDIGVLPLLPSPEANDVSFDKYRTYHFLKGRGFNTPFTFLSLEEAYSAVDVGEVEFPLIVKPRCVDASRNVFRARNFKELDVFFHYVPDMLIQELITGQEYTCCICNDLQGKVISVVPRRKMNTHGDGVADFETCDASNLIKVGLRIGEELGCLGHVGPLNADFFLQDNSVVILDINPRFGSGYPLSHLAGADFPLLIVKMIRGERIEPSVGRFRPGVVMMMVHHPLGVESPHFFSSVYNMRQ